MDIRTGDAALVDHYLDIAPVDIAVVCGLFGNITDADIRATISHVGTLTRRGGTVIWTRHRREPDLIPQIQEWFAEEGFAPLWLSDPAALTGVGTHRATRDPLPPRPGASMFTFVGMGNLIATDDHGK